MSTQYSRRHILKTIGTASASALLPSKMMAASSGIQIAQHEVEIQLSSISAHTLRLTILPINNGHLTSVPQDGSLVQTKWNLPVASFREIPTTRSARCGDLNVQVAPDPLTFTITDSKETLIQRLTIDCSTGSLSFVI